MSYNGNMISGSPVGNLSKKSIWHIQQLINFTMLAHK